MVKKLTARERADLRLKTLALTLAELHEIADEWDDLGEGERAGWSHDWDNEMGGLQNLAKLAVTSRLSQRQEEEYCRIVREIESATPIIERLRLYRPVLWHLTPRTR